MGIVYFLLLSSFLWFKGEVLLIFEVKETSMLTDGDGTV